MLYTIAAFYRFLPLEDLASLRQDLLAAFKPLNLCGTLLVAPEGINGTLAGSAASIEAMLTLLESKFGLPKSDVKFSFAEEKPFLRLKVRIKREIITFNQPSLDSTKCGTYVTAEEWNKLLDDPEVLVIDTRNRYETLIGTFAGAKDPQISKFSEFADHVRTKLSPKTHKKVAMFCTGGIRCEKASAFMRAEGFEEVYHLKGGILKYLEKIPHDQSKWIGECYVFDRRVGLRQGLEPSPLSMCFSCGYPLKEENKLHPLYEEGVACEHCYAATTDDDKTRYRMRQRQIIGTA